MCNDVGFKELKIGKIYVKNKNFILDTDEFPIYKNCINVILGENGAGKSTLLGEILQNKNILSQYKKILLTQNTYTFNRSCLNNIKMVLHWNNSKEDSMYYLKLVELEEKKNVLGNELSGGERKRLAFAMALATNADVILLDEPFANVDKKNQLELIKIIKSLKGNKTVLLVSHRLDICSEIGDSFIELEYGKIKKLDNNF